MHYCFYLVVTILLRFAIGMPPVVGHKPAARPVPF